MRLLTAIALGGVLGTLVRFHFTHGYIHLSQAQFPVGTMVANSAGCFILGFVWIWSEAKGNAGSVVVMGLTVGFCAALTTFSTLILDTAVLIRDGQTLKAFLNLVLSFLFGFILLFIGIRLGQKLTAL